MIDRRQKSETIEKEEGPRKDHMATKETGSPKRFLYQGVVSGRYQGDIDEAMKKINYLVQEGWEVVYCVGTENTVIWTLKREDRK